MSRAWTGAELAERIEAGLPGAAKEHSGDSVWIDSERILEVAEHLKSEEGIRFDLLNSLTAVDYTDHFELVYRFRSLLHNTTAVVKSKLGYGRGEMTAPSVYGVWRGADLLEREIWDLMGIRFEGHPNMKRLMLWDGFPGHPLRKDFLTYSQSMVDGVEPNGHQE